MAKFKSSPWQRPVCKIAILYGADDSLKCPFPTRLPRGGDTSFVPPPFCTESSSGFRKSKFVKKNFFDQFSKIEQVWTCLNNAIQDLWLQLYGWCYQIFVANFNQATKIWD